MSQTQTDITSGLSSNDECLFPLGPFLMNKSFLIVPEVKRMNLPLFQLKKKICKQWTTLHKKMITNQGIRNPIVTYLYSNRLDSVSPINQFLQIVDSNQEILHPGRYHWKLGDHYLLSKRVDLYHRCFMIHLQEIHLHLHHNIHLLIIHHL